MRFIFVPRAEKLSRSSSVVSFMSLVRHIHPYKQRFFKMGMSSGDGVAHLQSQLLRRWSQEDGEFKASQGKITIRPFLKNKIKTKGWRCGSSGRALA
jgi:hypothetical protein